MQTMAAAHLCMVIPHDKIKKVQDYTKKVKVTTLEWPSNNLDRNPIEIYEII